MSQDKSILSILVTVIALPDYLKRNITFLGSSTSEIVVIILFEKGTDAIRIKAINKGI